MSECRCFVHTEHYRFPFEENLVKDFLEGCCQLVARTNRKAVEHLCTESDVARWQIHIAVCRQIEHRPLGETMRLLLEHWE